LRGVWRRRRRRRRNCTGHPHVLEENPPFLIGNLVVLEFVSK
jgi:hypothetical protein